MNELYTYKNISQTHLINRLKSLMCNVIVCKVVYKACRIVISPTLKPKYLKLEIVPRKVTMEKPIVTIFEENGGEIYI